MRDQDKGEAGQATHRGFISRADGQLDCLAVTMFNHGVDLAGQVTGCQRTTGAPR